MKNKTTLLLPRKSESAISCPFVAMSLKFGAMEPILASMVSVVSLKFSFIVLVDVHAFELLTRPTIMQSTKPYSFSPLTFIHAFFMFSASASMIGLSHKILPAQPKSRNTSNRKFIFRSDSPNAR